MVNADVLSALEVRLGREYTRKRLEIEKDHEAQVFGQGINFFHFEKPYCEKRAVLPLKPTKQCRSNHATVAGHPYALTLKTIERLHLRHRDLGHILDPST